MKFTKILAVVAIVLSFFAVNVYADGCVPCEKGACSSPTWNCPDSEQVGCTLVDPCDVIFDICVCENQDVATDYFELGDVVGVKFDIISEGVAPGLYFNQADPTVSLYLYDNPNNTINLSNVTEEEQVACLELNQTPTEWQASHTFSNYVWENTDGITTGSSAELTPNNGACSVDSADEFTTLTAGVCDVGPDGILGTADDGTMEYEITAADIANERTAWRVTTPSLKGDWVDLQAYMQETGNSFVEMQVSLIDLCGGEGICEDCTTICSCKVKINICEQESASERCMYFPYVIMNQDNWDTGIAISNLDTSVSTSDMEYTITLIDAAGNEESKTFDSGLGMVNTYVIQDLINDNEWDLEGNAGIAKVQANFPVDGYSFNLSTTTGMVFGAGVLPRLDYDCDGVQKDSSDQDE